jgi:uncharacterized membrane protein (DUF4010 family)
VDEPSTALLIRNFAIALFIGALVGIDREKKKVVEPEQGVGGIRTFILFAMAGAVSAWLSQQLDSPWVFIATVAGVAATVIVGYYVQFKQDIGAMGLTTEIAAIVVCLLGGLTLFGYPGIAVALGIATSAILAFKEPIHGMVEKIGSDDLYAGLKLLIATFIVLPLLPNRPVDPLEAINPYRLWLLVILISGMSLVGYVAARALGARRGTALTGIFGGLVSSTAVTLSFAKRSKEDRSGTGIADVLAAGMLLAWVVMVVRVVVLAAVVHAPLVPALLVPLGAMGLVALGIGGFLYFRAARGSRSTSEKSLVPLSNPFNLGSAIKFAAIFAVILVAVKLAERYLPTQGLYAVAALAGLTDMDAITLSMANYARERGDATTAANGIVVAAFSNTVVKAVIVAVLGASMVRSRILAAAGGMIAAGLLMLLATSG